MTSGSPRDTSFNDEQYHLPYSPGTESHFWNFARSRIVARHLQKIQRSSSQSGGVILDVGCGPGIVVGHLRALNLACHGVETGKPALRPGIEQFVTTGTDASELPQSFRQSVSAILLLDVLEHIEDPANFLNILLKSFPSLKHFVVTVPARAELWSNYDEYYGHFCRYDRDGFCKLFTDLNLKIVTCKYFFNSLYPAMAIAARGVQKRSLETKPPSGFGKWVHAAIGSAFQLEERFPPMGKLPGTSLLGVFSV